MLLILNPFPKVKFRWHTRIIYSRVGIVSFLLKNVTEDSLVLQNACVSIISSGV
jgi:hypothetical protein